MNPIQFASTLENIPHDKNSFVFKYHISSNKFLYLSEGCKKITGYSVEEFMQEQSINIFDLIHPDSKPLLTEKHKPCISGNEVQEFEYKIIDRYGLTRWIKEISIHSYNKDNDETIEGLITDISADKRFKDIIEILQAYQNAVNTGSIVSITNAEGKIIFANEKFCEVSGYTRRELFGQSHSLINSQHHPKEFFSNMWKTILSGKSWRGEIKNKTKEGLYYWVDTVITPVFNNENKLIKFLSVRNLITVQKEQETELKFSEAKLKASQETAKLGNYEWNTTTDIVTGSKEFYRVLEIDEQPIPAKEIIKYVFPADLYVIRRNTPTPENSNKPVVYRFRYITPHKIIKYLEVRRHDSSFSQNELNETIINGTLQDITEIANLENKIISSIIETEEKERARIAAELHDDVCQQLVVNVFTLKMVAKKIENSEEHRQLSELLQNCINTSKTCLNTVRNVSHELMPSSFSINKFSEALEGCFATFSTLDKTKKYTLTFEGIKQEPEPQIAVNMYRVVQEFIRNSQKYSNAQNIRLNVSYMEAYLIITISDDGIGFDKTIIGNTEGIGLNNIFRRIESINASYELATDEGQGVTLTIFAPYK